MRCDNWMAIVMLGAMAVMISACGESDETAPDQQLDSASTAACRLDDAAESYDEQGFANNAAVELQLRAQLRALLKVMRDAEANLANQPTAVQLRALFDAGTASVRSIATPYIAAKVDGWFDEFAAAAGKTWSPTPTPGETGGLYGRYIFSARGTDLRQAVEKGLFAGALYHHALTIVGADVDRRSLDRLLAIYGSHPSFPADTAAATNPDEFVASYAVRRDKDAPRPPGPYTKIKQAFIGAQAALSKGAVCAAELETKLGEIFNEWERSQFATVIFYLDDAAKKLNASEVSDADKSSALHGYGEAVGFVDGWRTLPTTRRKISDAQIDELLGLLGAPPSGPVSSLALLTETAATLPKLGQAIALIRSIYGDQQTFY